MHGSSSSCEKQGAFLLLNHALYDLSAQTFATSGIIKQEAESQILLISAAELITEHETTQIKLTMIVLRT
jgi:hypothetical protein